MAVPRLRGGVLRSANNVSSDLTMGFGTSFSALHHGDFADFLIGLYGTQLNAPVTPVDSA